MSGQLFPWVPAGREAQMTVELAVVTPVVIVVALIVLNLMGFIEACAAFDQAALDCVIAHGVSPSAEQSEDSAVGEVSSALEAALSDYGSCEVSVRAERVGEGSEGSSFAVSALLTRYVCTLVYRPWPMVVRMPGVSYGAPFSLTHECELVVDRYRSGVVV